MSGRLWRKQPPILRSKARFLLYAELTLGLPCVSILTDPPIVKTYRSLSKNPSKDPEWFLLEPPPWTKAPLHICLCSHDLELNIKKNKHKIPKKKTRERGR